MKGFSIIAIAGIVLVVTLMTYFVNTIFFVSEEQGKIRFYQAEKFLEEQTRIRSIGESPILIYCNVIIEDKREFKTIFEWEGCDISYKGIKSKNCFPYVYEKAVQELENKSVVPALNEVRLNMQQKGYSCSYSIKNNTLPCNATSMFEFSCNLNQVETQEGIKIQRITIVGGFQ